MHSMIKNTFSPLLSLFIFTLGNALFTTLIVIRLHSEGASSIVVGLMSTAYYFGLVLGSFRIERFIVRVGHIRAFAAFASTLAVASLIQGIIIHTPSWLFLRFISGFVTAGLFIVIESWLLIESSVKTRGRILAIYMVALYAAQAMGQLLINLAPINTLILFAVVSILASASVIPLSMTYISSPTFSEPSTLNLKKLYQLSASGVIGCFCSGLLLGSIYGLMPLYITDQGYGASIVATLMFVIILGGMALQYPVGRLSDLMERRIILIFVSLATLCLSLGIILFPHNYWATIAIYFFFGGFIFTLYPLSISHACDHLDSKDIIASTQGLLLSYSVGATLGPIIAPFFMEFSSANGLFLYFIFVTAFMAIFFSWRKTQHFAATPEEHFIPMPQTTPIMSELDPRADP